jgi:hypothetical protein
MSQDTASVSTNTTRGDPARSVQRSLGILCQGWNVTSAGHDTIRNVANGVALDAEDCETRPTGLPFASRPSSTTPASNGT